MMHLPMPLPLVLAVAQPHNRFHEAPPALMSHLGPLGPLLPPGLLAPASVESVAVAINVSPASITCFSSPVVAVTAVETPHLFADEVLIVNLAQWKHHQFNLRTVHLWALQDLKMINLVADPTVAELLT